MKKIVIVDDHPVVREGMERLLESEADLKVCASIGSVAEALQILQQMKPDLVLADMTLPGRSGLELIKDLKALYPDIPVLVISMHDEKLYAERVMRAGGRGYVMKEVASEELINAVRCVLRGEIYMSSASAQRLAKVFAGHRGSDDKLSIQKLTDREFEVFQLIGLGQATREIAAQLFISPRTVDAHRAHIKDKLELKNGNELLRFAVRWVESGALGDDEGLAFSSPL